MTTMERITGGVDTHLDVHVAAALNDVGGLLGTASFPTTTAGYRQLLQWLSSFGEVVLVGVEGTGSYGAGLSRFLHSHRVGVVEVDRPNRQTRRLSGKSDPIDAISAARAALGGTANGAAKTRDGNVESLRVLRVAKVSACKARTQAINQIHSLVCTAPDELRDKLRQLPTLELVRVCAGLRPPASTDVAAITKATLRALARRVRHLDEEIAELQALIRPLVRATAPELLAHNGVGPDTAAALLIAAGDNPSRLRSEATFARLCGAAPIPATSGKTQHRHRLHRGGDRQANAALWRIRQYVGLTGGIRSRERTRAAVRLPACEREEISRGLAAGESLRCIAGRLGRAPSTVSREVTRNGGHARYRAADSDRTAWRPGVQAEAVQAGEQSAAARRRRIPLDDHRRLRIDIRGSRATSATASPPHSRAPETCHRAGGWVTRVGIGCRRHPCSRGRLTANRSGHLAVTVRGRPRPRTGHDADNAGSVPAAARPPPWPLGDGRRPGSRCDAAGAAGCPSRSQAW